MLVLGVCRLLHLSLNFNTENTQRERGGGDNEYFNMIVYWSHDNFIAEAMFHRLRTRMPFGLNIFQTSTMFLKLARYYIQTNPHRTDFSLMSQKCELLINKKQCIVVRTQMMFNQNLIKKQLLQTFLVERNTT